MSEWVEMLSRMCNLGYILSHNACGNIVFDQAPQLGSNRLYFKNWTEVDTYVKENYEGN